MSFRRAIRFQLLLAVVLVSGCDARPGLAPTQPPGPPATAVASAPREWSHPLSTAELLDAIAAAHQSAEPWRDVVFGAGLNGTKKPAPIERECAERTPCTVIGSIESVDDSIGVVALAHGDPLSDIPPPATPADLNGPVALRIPRTGPIEFLGHVQPATGALAWTVADAAAAIPNMTNGRVLAVDGWLTSELTSCGPAPFPPGPPLPNPFNCQPPGWIGSDGNGAVPKVDVQTFAYHEFATDPQEGGNGAPFPARHGIYLLRWVEYEAVNCHDCRRFLVVGRLDATTPSPNDVTDMPPVRSAAELALDLASAPRPVGTVVFVDGQILPSRPAGACPGPDACSIGTLAGQPVVATPYTVSLLLPDTDFPTHGVVALRVQPEGLEYLGFFGLIGDHSAIVPFSVLRDTSQVPRGPVIAIARGWLVGVSHPCPQPENPRDTPFGPCELAWLTPVAEQPLSKTATGYDIKAPTDGIVVQPAAYWNFAADPRSAEDIGSEPRLGAYVLRKVEDKPDQPDTRRGWQVVGRLEP